MFQTPSGLRKLPELLSLLFTGGSVPVSVPQAPVPGQPEQSWVLALQTPTELFSVGLTTNTLNKYVMGIFCFLGIPYLELYCGSSTPITFEELNSAYHFSWKWLDESEHTTDSTTQSSMGVATLIA